jgi:hypothetical protein
LEMPPMYITWKMFGEAGAGFLREMRSLHILIFLLQNKQ